MDFCRFATLHVESGDIDPMYPVLKGIYQAEGLSEEIALWRTLLYLAWYHAGSAQRAWDLWPEPTLIPPRAVEGFQTGIERRAFRGNRKAGDLLNAIVDLTKRKFGSLSEWVWDTTGPGGERGWILTRWAMEAFPYCGPWAGYKWADLLKHVHDFPITASDLGVGGGSQTAGPIPGMVSLYEAIEWHRCAEDRGLQMELLGRSKAEGVPFNGLDQLETSLCDFNSLRKGRYYVGHDIDAQQEQLQKIGAPDIWWVARAQAFSGRYRGEASGWDGVRTNLKGLYSNQRKMEWWS